MATKMGVEELVNLAVTPGRTEEETLTITLEICDWVNSQKRDGPLKATEALLPKINSRNERIALPALNVLDACVKNCGFAFHLQIATKRFLNELVRTFPEKPPTPLNAIYVRILELLATWRSELCGDKSRYKEDLMLINEMSKLLKSKGYKFPKVQSAVTIVNDARLLTEEELLEQDKKAQAAKLDELLRRGTPADLAAANDLMKVMASYEFEKKEDLKREVKTQLQKLEDDCKDCITILGTLQPRDDPTTHFKLQDLLSAIKTSRPKIQRSLEEEASEEQLGLLLRVNDLMNTVFENYESQKAVFAATGLSPAAGGGSSFNQGTMRPASSAPQQAPAFAAPAFSTPAFSAPVFPTQPQQPPQAKTSAMESLIDLDFGAPPAAQQPAAQQPFFQGFGALSLNGSSAPAQPLFPASFPAFGSEPAQATQAPFGFPPPQPVQQHQPIPILSPPPAQLAHQQPTHQQPAPSSPPPQYQAFANLPPSSSSSSTPSVATLLPATTLAQISQPMQPMQPMQLVQPMQPVQPTPVQAAAMPEKTLPAPAIGTSSNSTSLSNLYGNPNAGMPSACVLNKNGLEINAQFERVPNAAENIRIHCKIVNSAPTPLTDFVIQLAVPKSMKLRLEPLSSTSVAPVRMGAPPVTQKINLENPTNAQIRIRYKINYKIAGQDVEDQGEFANIPAF